MKMKKFRICWHGNYFLSCSMQTLTSPGTPPTLFLKIDFNFYSFAKILNYPLEFPKFFSTQLKTRKVTSKVPYHKPVLLKETISLLCENRDGGTYLDATFGDGGHSKAILDSSPQNKVYCIDRDRTLNHIVKQFQTNYKDRFKFFNLPFSTMSSSLFPEVKGFDGILFDLGVSSRQLDDPKRGFSFRPSHNGILDMRMEGPSSKSKHTTSSYTYFSCADLVNGCSQEELEEIIKTYGEDPHAKKIAESICKFREMQPIQTTHDLVTAISYFLPPKKNGSDIHPCTKTFQAFRIKINDELEELKKGLLEAEKLLSPKGRIVVISYHSLEDRMVKVFFKFCAGKGLKPTSVEPSLKILNQKVITPSDQEIKENPRSRSAKLRAAERLPTNPMGNLILSWEHVY